MRVCVVVVWCLHRTILTEMLSHIAQVSSNCDYHCVILNQSCIQTQAPMIPHSHHLVVQGGRGRLALASVGNGVRWVNLQRMLDGSALSHYYALDRS